MRLPRRLCPICGAKISVMNEAGCNYLSCSECPLEYGWGLGFSKEDLLCSWDNAPDNKKTIGKTKPKAVVKIDRNGNVIARYRSMSEAARENPMSKTSIENRTKRKLKHEFAICDFTFRLEDDIK